MKEKYEEYSAITDPSVKHSNYSADNLDVKVMEKSKKSYHIFGGLVNCTFYQFKFVFSFRIHEKMKTLPSQDKALSATGLIYITAQCGDITPKRT